MCRTPQGNQSDRPPRTVAKKKNNPDADISYRRKKNQKGDSRRCGVRIKCPKSRTLKGGSLCSQSREVDEMKKMRAMKGQGTGHEAVCGTGRRAAAVPCVSTRLPEKRPKEEDGTSERWQSNRRMSLALDLGRKSGRYGGVSPSPGSARRKASTFESNITIHKT